MSASHPRRVLWALALLALFGPSGCAGREPPDPASTQTEQVSTRSGERLTITGVTAHIEPGVQLTEASIVVRDGRIEAVGTGITPAADSAVLDARGLHASSGWWNSHVHFTAPELAANPAATITSMLLQHGFTAVVDTGSVLAQTIALRDAIKAGVFPGPHIVLANGSFVYTDGTPSYLPGIQLPEVSTPAAAQPMVAAVLDAGADGIKLFAGSFMTPEHTIHLPPAIIEAIVDAAQERGAFTMAHPTTLEGLRNSVNAGVDVIAHTTAPQSQMAESLLVRMRSEGTALIPTLQLWRYEMNRVGQPLAAAQFLEDSAVAQLAQLHAAGIEILFGTDVGYMSDYDPAAEFALMRAAGMDWPATLRSLTTAPARRFGRGPGTLTRGAPADIVLFAGDPVTDPKTLADVRYTLIDGQVVYTAP